LQVCSLHFAFVESSLFALVKLEIFAALGHRVYSERYEKDSGTEHAIEFGNGRLTLGLYLALFTSQL